jgi:hypothetical protein
MWPVGSYSLVVQETLPVLERHKRLYTSVRLGLFRSSGVSPYRETAIFVEVEPGQTR